MQWVIIIAIILVFVVAMSIHPKGGRQYTIYGADGSVIHGRRNWSDRLDDGFNIMQIQVDNWTDSKGLIHEMNGRRMRWQKHWIIAIEEDEKVKRV